MFKDRVLVITGPTAVGKTGMSLILAKHHPIEIISADSRQIYKYLDIGTAKPSKEELNSVKHHLIDELDPTEHFSAWKFKEQASDKIQEIFAKDKYPVIVGGTGLYLKALIEGLFNEDVKYDKENIKKDIENKINLFGNQFLIDELQKKDPKIFEIYPDLNPRRLFRALEFYYGTGNKFSRNIGITTYKSDIKFLYLVITDKRETVYNNINKRVINMWKSGLVDETISILKKGYDKNLNSLNTVGYKETIALLEGNINEERAIELIQQNTRRYAKRQITWFKGVENAVWLPQWDQNSAYTFPMIIEEFFYKQNPRFELYQSLFKKEDYF